MCGCKDCQGITLLKGTDGRGIVSITAQEDGTFIYLYTDGTTYTSPDLTGPQGLQGDPGPQGDPGTDGTNGIGFNDLVWAEIPLVNDWLNVGDFAKIPYWAVAGNMLFLRGEIEHTTYTPLKSVFWEAAPTTSTNIDVSAFDKILSSSVLMRIFSNNMSYEGPNNANLLISLDSLPIIRLY